VIWLLRSGAAYAIAMTAWWAAPRAAALLHPYLHPHRTTPEDH
jgi:hypothetical protein